MVYLAILMRYEGKRLKWYDKQEFDERKIYWVNESCRPVEDRNILVSLSKKLLFKTRKQFNFIKVGIASGKCIRYS